MSLDVLTTPPVYRYNIAYIRRQDADSLRPCTRICCNHLHHLGRAIMLLPADCRSSCPYPSGPTPLTHLTCSKADVLVIAIVTVGGSAEGINNDTCYR